MGVQTGSRDEFEAVVREAVGALLARRDVGLVFRPKGCTGCGSATGPTDPTWGTYCPTCVAGVDDRTRAFVTTQVDAWRGRLRRRGNPLGFWSAFALFGCYCAYTLRATPILAVAIVAGWVLLTMIVRRLWPTVGSSFSLRGFQGDLAAAEDIHLASRLRLAAFVPPPGMTGYPLVAGLYGGRAAASWREIRDSEDQQSTARLAVVDLGRPTAMAYEVVPTSLFGRFAARVFGGPAITTGDEAFDRAFRIEADTAGAGTAGIRILLAQDVRAALLSLSSASAAPSVRCVGDTVTAELGCYDLQNAAVDRTVLLLDTLCLLAERTPVAP